MATTQHTQFDDLFVQLGLENISRDEKLKHLEEWNGMVRDRVMLRITDALSEADKQSLEQLEGDAFNSFVQEKAPQFDDLVVQESLKFREEMIADFNYMRGKFAA